MDFNDDSIIGRNTSTVESQGDIQLKKDALNMGWVQLSDGTLDDITHNNHRVGDGSYKGWSQVAAETIDGQNKVIWTHPNGRMSEWTVDASWNYTSHNTHSAHSDGFLAMESSFNMDFNDDSIIGDPTA